MLFNRALASLFISSFILLVAACSSTSVDTSQQTATTIENKDSAQATTAASVNPAANASYQQALEAIKKGDKKQAIRLLTSLEKDYPDLSGPSTNLGLIYFHEGDLARAESAFQQALARNPRNAVALQHMGIIYRHQGKFNEAEQAYLAALKQQPDYANAHLNLAILYDIYLIKLSSALRHYEKYQSLQATEDDTVKKWIIGLKRRVKVSK